MKALVLHGKMIAVLKDGKWVPFENNTLADIDAALRDGDVIDLSDQGRGEAMFFWGVVITIVAIGIIKTIYELWK